MTKIKELLDIKSSYSNQVDLHREFNDRALKKDRMSKYKPIKSHRKAFEIIAEGAYTTTSKRCFVLSGSYGTGKSHLLLMAANYFESQSDTDEMIEFFKNYAESESEELDKRAELLKTIRKENRYIVAISNYGTNKFETYILKAIEEALNREGISIEEMSSYYLEAVKKIGLWGDSEDQYYYEKLEKELENRYSEWTINKLISELKQYNKDAIDIFKELHKIVTTSEFEFDKDNYVEIIKEMTKSKIIRDNFAGLVILYDEFDYQLKGKRFDLDEFQKFAQMCAASIMDDFPIIFVASTHRSFVSYKTTYNSEDFSTVSDRIREIPLETEGIEEIISAVVNPQKNSNSWKENIVPNLSMLSTISNECSSLKIFNLSSPKIKKRIVENIYPMHPMATYSLLKLASDLGSNNRSVVTFFADEKQYLGSFSWYINNHDILDKNGKLQFYSVASLFEFFKDRIKSDNGELRSTIRDLIRNFETSLKELNKYKVAERANVLINELDNEIYEKILRVMIIYQIIGMAINEVTLKFGLYLNSETEIKELQHSIKVACSKKIIYYNDQNKSYEFRRSDAVDVVALINEYKTEPNNAPLDIIKELEALAKDIQVDKLSKFLKTNIYLDAKRYNYTFSEDKRFLKKYATVKDIENKAIFQNLNKLIDNEDDFKKGFEGIALYVICESEDEVKKAKELVKHNYFERIIVGVTNEEIPMYDVIFSLRAALKLDVSEFSTQDQGVLKETIRQYDNAINQSLTKYNTSKNLNYYGKDGDLLTNSANEDDAAIAKVLETIYESKRNKIRHEDLNKSHEFKDKGNSALKEAVEILLDANKELAFRKDYAADRGDKRYLQNVLYANGVIKQTHTVGQSIICEVESNVNKYKSTLPALAEMINVILDNEFHLKLSPSGFVEGVMKEYGIGYNSAILFFAMVKRYFRDSLTISNVGEIGILNITSYDSLLDLLYNKKHKNTIIEYKKIETHDEALIKALKKIFNPDELEVSKDATLDGVHSLLSNWYKGLMPIQKVKSIYEGKLDKLIEVFNKIENIKSRDFILEEFKTIYGYDKDDLILEDKVQDLAEKFAKDKVLIESGYQILIDKIIRRFGDVFEQEISTMKALDDILIQWFEGLSDIQKSYNNDLQTTESKQLVMNIGKSTSHEDFILDKLPIAYSLNKISEWTTDKTESYISKVREAKKHIEENVFLVEPPIYSIDALNKNEIKLSDSNIQVEYRQQAIIKITAGSNHKVIYATSNDEEPSKEEIQREEDSKEITIKVTNDKPIKFCAFDNEGKFSKTIRVEFINQDNKYVVKYDIKPKQTNLFNKEKVSEEYKISVVLPKDTSSLKTCLNSILNETENKYSINKKEVINILNDIIRELQE
ncbi:hypothetical protein CLHOM_30350 [Clostridium homopropionicum DSM 5847]|uniref:Uncharacterized protein n=1 Tax=Clostridium homopropionicum DSM 5847 TaxID=1121318 RepID=A0A0L6Z711_9CLOT|nr:hypothetical protein [Clostridium homopropionicum]KOA18751.1 hypothetical protein CLHOM_30350 [Clostridium homopropionicum DSM 5847]SFG54793.1 hypothetical protein SAMN04488501_110172 [Clostridium homopropionicum]